MKTILCLAAAVAAITLAAAGTPGSGTLPGNPECRPSVTTKPGRSGNGDAKISPDRLEDNRNRFLTNCQVSSRVLPPAGGLVVVAEGDYEARSLGSYSVRLYAAHSTNAADRLFPITIDNFQCGLVQKRENGFIEKVFVRDLLGDGREEIIVTIRSVGNWGLGSAVAFRVDDGQLKKIASVSDFPATADVVTLLSFKLKPAATGTKRWFEAVEAVIRITDGQGHVPDIGSEEWQRAVSKKVFENLESPAPAPNTKEWFAAMNRHVLAGLPQVDANKENLPE